MVERDSSRDLLEELEDGWGTPASPKVAAAKAAVLDEQTDLDAVDSGWLDELFPEAEEPEEEDDEPEPELPDERVDPVAFAAAKKAREDRASAKKDKKKAKLEAKRSRQKQKALAMRQKQKQKQKKAAGSATGPASKKSPKAKASSSSADSPMRHEADSMEAVVVSEASRPSTKPKPARGKPSTTSSIKLLAIVLAALLALAALAAVLAGLAKT